LLKPGANEKITPLISGSLDIRDRNWFLERAPLSEARKSAASKLIDLIVRPYFENESIFKKSSSPLSTNEAKAALVYLGLQWEDDVVEKGLTKLAFDALVRAALRHTTSTSRMSREQIHAQILLAIGNSNQLVIDRLIDNSLHRLTKKYIRHWQKEDEFNLTYEESQRILCRIAELEKEKAEFIDVVKANCSNCLKDTNPIQHVDLDEMCNRILRILEKLFYKHGELFVSAVSTGSLVRIGLSDLKDIIFSDISQYPVRPIIIDHYPDIISTAIRYLIIESAISTQLYLRKLANSYTLYSFLNQTPDIQAATRKLFSYGKVWIDTTVILPLIAEQLDDEYAHKLTKLIKSCVMAGIEFRVTSGIIEEIHAHMNKCMSCLTYQANWKGRMPFLFSQFIGSGRESREFSKWIDLFRGTDHPEDDIKQYLYEEFCISVQDLSEEAHKVPDKLRWELDTLWTSAHIDRRQDSQFIDASARANLIKHDVENYLGILALRHNEQVSELGYKHWLLTLDHIAWDIRKMLREEYGDMKLSSPLLSLPYLVNSMIFGPSRTLVGKANELRLPLLLDIEMTESVTCDIVELADKVRLESQGLPEYVIRRKVRDGINSLRRRECIELGNIETDQDS